MRIGSLRRHLRFTHLQMVIALDDLRHMGRAADFLSLTQSAVSRMLTDLEAQLDTKLFDRSVRGTSPTAAGKTLVAFARQAIGGLGRMTEELEALAEEDRPHIRLGTPMLAGAPAITAGVARMKALDPHALVTISEATSEELLTRLRLHELDMVVTRVDWREPPADLSAVPLFSDAAVAVCRPGHPILARGCDGWAMALACPWILPARGWALRDRFDRFLVNGDLPRPADMVEAGSWLSALILAREMEALALVPESLGDYFSALGVVARVPLALFESRSAISLVQVAHRRPDAPVARLIEAFREEALGTDHSGIDMFP